MIRTLLVDDEALARHRMHSLLQAYPYIQVVAEAGSVAEARAALASNEPIQLVFLDVQMPGAEGFELFQGNVDCRVVMVTAYPEFALRAFDAGASDYLTKPVNPARLAMALERLFDTRETRFQVRDATTTHLVSAEQIRRLAGAGDYVELHLVSGERLLSDERMRVWEARLSPGFVRLHRSHLVARRVLVQVRRSETRGYMAVLDCGTTLPIARARLAQVRRALDGSGASSRV